MYDFDIGIEMRYFGVSHAGDGEEDGGGSISPIVIIASRGRTQWRSRFSNGLIIIGCVWRGKKMAWRQEMDTALIQRCCGVCR